MADRLAQLIDYARGLAVMAENGRGNIKDTADIVRALEELQAYHEFLPNVTPMPRPKRSATPTPPPRPPRQRKTA